MASFTVSWYAVLSDSGMSATTAMVALIVIVLAVTNPASSAAIAKLNTEIERSEDRNR